MIHRFPERREERTSERAGEESGEAVLRAQMETPAYSALPRAESAVGGAPRFGGGVPEPAISQEQEERIAARVLEEINYNRMAAEVLDRVERRLRTERRKIGR